MPPKKWFLNKLMLLCLTFPYCTCTDTLSPAQSITDEDKLVSSGKKFALGLFRPGNSRNRYIGIWYHKIPEHNVIWVANRDHPIRENSSGVLTINSDGNLVILDGITNSTVWSSNASIVPRNNNTIAKLLDSGNLVLTQKDSTNILWQSFDYPTDTSLPGMKSGINRRLGLNWTLTSWKSEDDPGRGNYTLMLDPRGSPQFFLYKGKDRLWRSGPWNGRRPSATPEFELPNLFGFDFVNTQDEIYMTYGVTNNSTFTRVVLNVSGLAQRLAWIEESRQWTKFWSLPRDDCDYYGRCGPYSLCNDNNPTDCSCLPGFEPKSPREWYWGYYKGGCVRKRAAQYCGKGDGFLKKSNVKVPDTSVARVDKSLSLEECQQECLRSCNCTAYTAADIRGETSGCLAWYGVLMDTKEFISGEQDLFVRVDAVELAASARKDSKGNRGKRRTLTILSVSLVLGLLLLVSCGYYLVKMRRKRKEELEETTTNTELPQYDLRTIIAATDNFSATNKLGEGGFGPVYWGRLFDGQEIAVKRLSKSSGQGVEELKNEIVLIANLQHRNLVRILGCCFHKEEKMLIYEYLPNKSLDSFIFDESRRLLLDWDTRFRIIVGIARGVMYLHQDSRLRIIHRDLKASNVLLDAEMNPKISDFGIAKIFGGDRSQANTNRVVGTYGYMSPEYVMNGLFSEKSDVFSFGVLLLQIISGKKNSDYYHEDPSTNLIGHVWQLWKEDSALNIVDASLCGSYSTTHEVLRCIQIGLLCVQGSPSDRPTMSTVVFMLGNEAKLPLPRQPAFVTSKIGRSPNSCPTGTGSGSVASINDVTITMFQAR